MRNILRLLLVITAVLSLVANKAAAQDDPTEPLSALHTGLISATAAPRPIGGGALIPESLVSCSGYTIACGQTVTHASFRCELSSGVLVDDYDFQAVAGQTVTVSASSTYLFVSIFNSAGNPVAVSPSPPSSFETVSYTFPSGGTYSIRVYSSYNTTYTLTVSCSGGSTPPPPPPAGCSITTSSLCLLSNRFGVEVSWRVPAQGTSGFGHAITMTSDTGHFWFFSSTNVELVVKVLDGRPVNGKYWVFFGALSDVEYTITVRDTNTGAVRTYFNPSGRMASVADTSAF
jgi:hypothetical protein